MDLLQRRPALQTEYSLFERTVETNGVLGILKELGIGFMAYSPLGRGFLSGAIRNPSEFTKDDWRRTDPRFQGDNFYRNLTLVEKIRKLASEKDVTPTQLALAWILNQGIVAILGTKRTQFLKENLGAATINLTKQDLELIADEFPRGGPYLELDIQMRLWRSLTMKSHSR